MQLFIQLLNLKSFLFSLLQLSLRPLLRLRQLLQVTEHVLIVSSHLAHMTLLAGELLLQGGTLIALLLDDEAHLLGLSLQFA